MAALKVRSSQSRKPHLSMALALVALLAQIWMVQVSTVHQGRMLAQQLMAGDVCTQQSPAGGGAEAPPVGHKMEGSSACPICGVATVGFAPGREPEAKAAPQAPAYHGQRYATAPTRAWRHAKTLPQAQAPPVA